jgi:hypothetical protein
MAQDRNDAFKAWRNGILTDAQLAKVVDDLQTVVDVFCAMDRAADLALVYLRQECESAKDMQRRRKNNKR